MAAPYPASPPVAMPAAYVAAANVPAVMAVAPVAMMPMGGPAGVLSILDRWPIGRADLISSAREGQGAGSGFCRCSHGFHGDQRGRAAGGDCQKTHHERSTIHLELLDPTQARKLSCLQKVRNRDAGGKAGSATSPSHRPPPRSPSSALPGTIPTSAGRTLLDPHPPPSDGAGRPSGPCLVGGALREHCGNIKVRCGTRPPDWGACPGNPRIVRAFA